MATEKSNNELKEFYIENNVSDEELADYLYSLQDNNKVVSIRLENK
ncbi:hypothetical protein HDR60_00840 [bacterium]|nr:hypothetical protein [bacterium]